MRIKSLIDRPAPPCTFATATPSSITVASDEPGTGLGGWTAVGADGFAFGYTNYHFNAAAALDHTVMVEANGTFKGSTMTGVANLTTLDATGKAKGPARRSTFTGRRFGA